MEPSEKFEESRIGLLQDRVRRIAALVSAISDLSASIPCEDRRMEHLIVLTDVIEEQADAALDLAYTLSA
jgi:hypothetical protein